jgi:hypothetical protein
MEKYIWILQLVLALFFLMPAILKLKTPKDKLVANGNMPPDGSIRFIRLLGTMEILGVATMVLSVFFEPLKIFTLLAAIGFAIVMTGALVVHYKKREFKKLPILGIAFLLSLVVVYLNK